MSSVPSAFDMREPHFTATTVRKCMGVWREREKGEVAEFGLPALDSMCLNE